MKNLNYLLLAAFCFVFLIDGCKKKDDKDETPTPVNYLCDGNGEISYIPLDSANNWTYSFKMGGVSQSVHPSISVTGHVTYGGKVYAKLEDATSYYGVRYYREDASHNIYTYSSAEYLEVPASPTLNQSWTGSDSYTRTVTNLSASISTSSCSYTGLLEISEYSGTTLKGKYYYKKGLGLMYSEVVSFFTNTFTLTSVTLN